MSNRIRILGAPVLALRKGLEDDGVTFGLTSHLDTRERWSRRPFSFVLADEMLRDFRAERSVDPGWLVFWLPESTIEQIRKDLESGAYRL